MGLAHLCLLLLATVATAQECVNKLEWSTKNAQIHVNGKSFVLRGISYFGFETEKYYPHGLWTFDLNFFLDFIKNNGFNAIRVPFSLELVKKNPGGLDINCQTNAEICKMNALDVLNVFINRAAARGLLIMLDNHRITANGGISDLWYNNEYPESTVIELWKTLLNRVKGKWNVFAIDLKNEPHDSASWGNSNPATDWNKAAERMINALSDFEGLFFVEGIEWGNRLEGAGQFPINTGNADLNNRVVYSPHCYGPDVYDRPEFNTPDFPTNLEAIYNGKYGFVAKATGQPVVVGEWGGRARPGTRDLTWNQWFVEYLRRNCMTNNFYWDLNPNSGDTGGLLEDDWQTPIQRKIDLTIRAQPNPTKFQVSGNQICITHGEFPEQQCRIGGGFNPVTSPTVDTTTRGNTGGGSNGGVSLTAVAKTAWSENNRQLREFTLRMRNNGSQKVCSVDIQIGAELKQYWNLQPISGNVYRTPSWFTIAPGDTVEQIGVIASGNSPTATIVSVQHC